MGVPGGIALTNDRKFVAVFRGSNRQLRYQTGRIDGGVAYLGSVWPYDKGLTPSICLAENGSFVEVHQSENEATLWVRHGFFDGTTLNFAEQVASQYDTGMEPSVTCNGQHVLSTHKSPGDDDDDNRLFYNLGRSLDQVLTGH